MELDFKQTLNLRNECLEFARSRVNELRPLVFVDDAKGTVASMRWKLEDVYEAIINRKHEFSKAEKRKLVKLGKHVQWSLDFSILYCC